MLCRTTSASEFSWSNRRVRRNLQLLTVLFGCCAAIAPARAVPGYQEINLVSDLPGLARFLDPDLVNPWGLASSSVSPIWVSDNHTGLSTIYNGQGQKQALVVTIPPAPGGTPPASPTGVVFNTLLPAFGGARFIFATEDGTVAAWSGGSNALLKVDNSAAGAVYKGIALGVSGPANLIYAANFKAGTIDVFDNNFSPTTVAGGFTDPNIPAGFAPFNIQNINGQIYVTYAKQDASGHDDVPGPGNGFVDVFTTDGVLVRRLVSNGVLNSPWGLALAPGDFGPLSNDLLVGNFGDGTINAFDPTTGISLGPLTDQNGAPIVIEGLWGLLFGNGGNGGLPNQLFFAAGIPGPDELEDHGLFGFLAVPEPGSLGLMLSGLTLLALRRRRD